MNKIKVIKTNKLNQRKLTRLARRYNITPIQLREIQLGYVEEIPEAAAVKMIAAGWVKRAKSKEGPLRSADDKVRNIKPVESTFTMDELPVDVTVDDTTIDNIVVIDDDEEEEN